jgi:hypothetical protein
MILRGENRGSVEENSPSNILCAVDATMIGLEVNTVSHTPEDLSLHHHCYQNLACRIAFMSLEDLKSNKKIDILRPLRI